MWYSSYLRHGVDHGLQRVARRTFYEGAGLERLEQLSLVTGALPLVLTALGALGACWLLFGGRTHSRRAVPIGTTAALVLTVVLYIVVEKVWHPFPDPIVDGVYAWIGIGVAGLVLLVPRMRRSTRWIGRIVTVLAAVALVVTAGVQINRVYGQYPTIADALGLPDSNRIDFANLPGPTGRTVDGTPLDSVWKAPQNLPSAGRVTSAAIPGAKSGFAARDAQLYLPPAYFVDPRPLLPVLVLLTGQPGDPRDWFSAGKLAVTMDDFAKEHGGLAPIVVIADGLGSELANPLCMDSKLGNAGSYLGVDVPAWTKANLQVNPDPRAWAIAGLSYGGTCALQMATNYPDVYPTFIDMSGQTEPTLGDRQRTVDAAFGGDESAYDKVNPANLMASRTYPNSAGVFVVGSDDKDFRSGQQAMYDKAKAAGMDVLYVELPGGHSWAVWQPGLRTQLGWLAHRLGLTAS